MADLAQFGIAVDTSQVDVARSKLTGMSQDGHTLSTSLQGLTGSFTNTTQSMMRYVQQSAAAQQALQALIQTHSEQLQYLQRVQLSTEAAALSQVNYITALKDTADNLGTLQLLFLGMDETAVKQGDRLGILAGEYSTTTAALLDMQKAVPKLTDNISEQSSIIETFSKVLHDTGTEAQTLRQRLLDYVGDTSGLSDTQVLDRFINKIKDLGLNAHTTADAMKILGASNQDVLLKIQSGLGVAQSPQDTQNDQLRALYAQQAVKNAAEVKDLSKSLDTTSLSGQIAAAFKSSVQEPLEHMSLVFSLIEQEFGKNVEENVLRQNADAYKGFGSLGGAAINTVNNSSILSGATFGAGVGSVFPGLGTLAGAGAGAAAGAFLDLPTFNQLLGALKSIPEAISRLDDYFTTGEFKAAVVQRPDILATAGTGGMLGFAGGLSGVSPDLAALGAQGKFLQELQQLESAFPELEQMRAQQDGLTAPGSLVENTQNQLHTALQTYFNNNQGLIGDFITSHSTLAVGQAFQSAQNNIEGKDITRQTGDMLALAQASTQTDEAVTKLKATLAFRDVDLKYIDQYGQLVNAKFLDIKRAAEETKASLDVVMPAYSTFLSQSGTSTKANDLLQATIDLGGSGNPVAGKQAQLSTDTNQLVGVLDKLQSMGISPSIIGPMREAIYDANATSNAQILREQPLLFQNAIPGFQQQQQLQAVSTQYNGIAFGAAAANQQGRSQAFQALAALNGSPIPQLNEQQQLALLQGTYRNTAGDKSLNSIIDSLNVGGKTAVSAYDTQHGEATAMALAQAAAKLAEAVSASAGGTPFEARQAGLMAQLKVPNTTMTQAQVDIELQSAFEQQVGAKATEGVSSMAQAKALTELIQKSQTSELQVQTALGGAQGLLQGGNDPDRIQRMAQAYADAAKAAGALAAAQAGIAGDRAAQDLKTLADLLGQYGGNANMAAAALERIQTARANSLVPGSPEDVMLQAGKGLTSLGQLGTAQAQSLSSAQDQFIIAQAQLATFGASGAQKQATTDTVQEQLSFQRKLEQIAAPGENAPQSVINDYQTSISSLQTIHNQNLVAIQQAAQLKGALSDLQAQEQAFEQPFLNAAQSIQTAFEGAFEQAFGAAPKSAQSTASIIKNTFLKLVSDMAALFVEKPIVGGILNALGLGDVANKMGLGNGASSLIGNTSVLSAVLGGQGVDSQLTRLGGGGSSITSQLLNIGAISLPSITSGDQSAAGATAAANFAAVPAMIGSMNFAGIPLFPGFSGSSFGGGFGGGGFGGGGFAGGAAPVGGGLVGGGGGGFGGLGSIMQIGGLLKTFGLNDVGGQFGNFFHSIGLGGGGSGSGGGFLNNLFSPVQDFLDTPLFTAASPTLTGFGTSAFTSSQVASSLGEGALDASSVGSGAGFETAASSAGGLPAAATIGSAIGGFGAGFGAGSLIGGFEQSALGKTGPGPQIGAGVGAAIGVAAAALAPETFGISLLVGGLLGGAAGGAGGGLIGPKPPSPFSSTPVSIDNNGFLQVGNTIGQGVDKEVDQAQARTQASQLNQQLMALGLTITSIQPQSGFAAFDTSIGGTTDKGAFQFGSNSPKGPVDVTKFGSVADAFGQFRFGSGDKVVNDIVSPRSFGSIDELNKLVTFLNNVYEPALKVNTIFGQLAQQMIATRDQINNTVAQARSFGVDPNKDLIPAYAANFNAQVQHELLAITDPLQAALNDYDSGAQIRLALAQQIGGDINTVETLNAKERLQIISQFGQQANTSLKALLINLTQTDAGGQTPNDQYSAALISYNATIQKLQGGDTSAANLDALAAQGSTLVGSAKNVFSVGPQFAAVYQRVLEDTLRYAPAGSDDGSAASALARLQANYGGNPVLQVPAADTGANPVVVATSPAGTNNASPTVTQLIQQSGLGQDIASGLAPGLATLGELIQTTNTLLQQILTAIQLGNQQVRTVLDRLAA